MIPRRRLLLATNNPGKVKELKALLASLPGLGLVTPADLGLDLQVEESGADFAANARLKAQAFSEASCLPSLADDSGLEVEALDGGPGLHSNRFFPGAETDPKRRAALLHQLEGFPRPWKARFRSTICLALPGGAVHLADGICAGEIIPEERGEGGFGYDRIFLVEGTSRTMAELSLEQKNRVSHRARALEQMKPILIEVLKRAGES